MLIFIDVGTVPQEESLFNFYKILKTEKNVGGVSGFMSLLSNFKDYYVDDYKNDNIDETEP